MSELDDAYASTTPDDNRRVYKRWAATYESDFITSHAYVYHQSVVAAFGQVDGRIDGPILDVGCGTGLVGRHLAEVIGGVIHGVDISPEMLAEAAAKQRSDGSATYEQLIEADLTLPLKIATDTYAGVISAGTFTHGHVGPDAIRELVRISMPGAVAALGINEHFFADRGFGRVLDDLVATDRIEPFDIVKVRIYDEDRTIDEEHAATKSSVAVFQVR